MRVPPAADPPDPAFVSMCAARDCSAQRLSGAAAQRGAARRGAARRLVASAPQRLGSAAQLGGVARCRSAVPRHNSARRRCDSSAWLGLTWRRGCSAARRLGGARRGSSAARGWHGHAGRDRVRGRTFIWSLFSCCLDLSWFYAIYPGQGNKPGCIIPRSSHLSARRRVLLLHMCGGAVAARRPRRPRVRGSGCKGIRRANSALAMAV